MDIDIKIYAPVIIPTLCRYQHFIDCVESLSRCIGAENTELFIGLDYPLNDSHRAGYEKISSYIDNGISGFKKVYVIRHEQNVGVGNNIKSLRLKLEERYDRYIYTEDDNQFSPNFLEYINKGLELYKDDSRVIGICGYAYPFNFCSNISGYPYNAYPMQSFNAWGCGYWTDKRAKVIEEFSNAEYADYLIHSWKLVRKLFKKKHHITVHRLMFRYKKTFSDLMWRAYCALNDTYCIFPVISKTANHGHDGTGLNCTYIKRYALQEIDKETTFTYDDFEVKSYPVISNIHEKLFAGTRLMRIQIIIEYLLFRLGFSLHDNCLIKILTRKRIERANRKLK